MLENVLMRRNCSARVKIAVKSLVSAGLVALAVVLPLIVHAAVGTTGGVTWLPMYLPVLLGGCLLGLRWGLGVGIASPLVSFLITLAFGGPMPAAERLPFMIAELAVFAAVSGTFSQRIAENALFAFPAVLLAQVTGRAVFMLLVSVFQSALPFTSELIWAQIQTGLLALLLQAVIVPFAVIGLSFLLRREKKND